MELLRYVSYPSVEWLGAESLVFMEARFVLSALQSDYYPSHALKHFVF